MNIEAIGFTERGCARACELRDALVANGHAVNVSGPERFASNMGIAAYEAFDVWTRDAFATADALLFVSATGIAVRAISPYVRDKFTDPAVVSIDEAGSFVVPLLSGHVGGANDLAREVAAACGAQAVISTATDVNGAFAIDEWARKNNLAILDRVVAKEISAAVLAGQSVGFASDFPWEGSLPDNFVHAKCDTNASLLSHLDNSPIDEAPGHNALPIPDLGASISLDPDNRPFDRTLRLVPRAVTVGVGCKRDTPAQRIRALLDESLSEARVAREAVVALASIDVKSDEAGLLEVANAHGWKTLFYSAEELAAVPGEFTASAFVAKTVGVDNVCERAACANGNTLLQGRRSKDGVTIALGLSEVALNF